MREEYEVVVIGGGMAGLAAANELRDRDVLLLESADRVGGRVNTRLRQPYWMSVGATIIGGADSPMGSLALDLGLDLLPIEGDATTVWCNGRLIRSGRVSFYPFRLPFSLAGRLSLVTAGLRLKAAARRAMAQVGDAVHGNRHFTGEYPTVAGDEALDAIPFSRVLGRMFRETKDLFRSSSNRLGGEPHEISGQFASAYTGKIWVSGKRHIYTVRGGLGEIARGLRDRMAEKLLTGAEVLGVTPGEERAEIEFVRDGKRHTVFARYVIFAAPAPVARKVIKDLPERKAFALDQVRFGPYVVMSATTSETTARSYEDIYATLVVGRTICMLFNLANPLRRESNSRIPGGSLMMYAGGDRARALMAQNDDQIRSTMLSDLFAVYPDAKGTVEDTWVQRLPEAFPYWAPGRMQVQDDLASPLKNVFFAGDWVEYPATDPAVQSGQLAARSIRKRLEHATASRALPASGV